MHSFAMQRANGIAAVILSKARVGASVGARDVSNSLSRLASGALSCHACANTAPLSRSARATGGARIQPAAAQTELDERETTHSSSGFANCNP
jgi:hypothetical protein